MFFTQAYNELSFYTLAHADQQYFIHQHIVDAQTAQTADEHTKPITIVFALAGLYLFIEKSYSGKQVQQAHMRMAKNKTNMPLIILPDHRGNITDEDVLRAEPGAIRDALIKEWCEDVWNAYEATHNTIRQYCRLTA